jgi:acetyl-CoA acetyltransferase
MREVYVVAVGMIPFGKHPDKGIKDLTALVMKNLFDHSPVAQGEIEAAWMANAGWGMSAGQHCIRGHRRDSHHERGERLCGRIVGVSRRLDGRGGRSP